MTEGKIIKPSPGRLGGLDLARFFALAAMVVVNFDVVLVPVGQPAGALAELFQGRAAALFVVLAGVGFGLQAQRIRPSVFTQLALRRSLFLFSVGLLNLLVFPADIIHYYGVYFLLGLPLVWVRSWMLWLAMALLPLGFLLLVLTLNYDAGWDWDTYHYEGLWTGAGFFRNLFFNGWHPVVPWFGFFMLGLWLARLNLDQRRTQVRLMVAGGCVLGSVTWLSSVVAAWVGAVDPEALPLVGLSPIPPGPFYLVAGSALATLAIGSCLMLSTLVSDVRAIRWLRVPGRQTLTLYVAHIIVGMGLMEFLGLVGAGSASQALVWSGGFVAGAVLFANLWTMASAYGPLEWVMRRLTSVRLA